MLLSRHFHDDFVGLLDSMVFPINFSWTFYGAFRARSERFRAAFTIPSRILEGAGGIFETHRESRRRGCLGLCLKILAEVGLGTEADAAPRPPEVDMLAAHDAVSTDAGKDQH